MRRQGPHYQEVTPMLAGKVVGNVVSTQKHRKLVGCKLLVVELAGAPAANGPARVVAVDTLGAGKGEEVLLVSSSAARVALGDMEIPVDLAIVGIVDRVEIIPG